MLSGIELIKRIDEVLDEKGMTRKHFSHEVEIQPNTMGNWKSNNSMPPVETVVRLAKALGVSVDWLCNGNPDFEKKELILGQMSRKNIRKRIYKSIIKKKQQDLGDSFANYIKDSYKDFFKNFSEKAASKYVKQLDDELKPNNIQSLLNSELFLKYLHENSINIDFPSYRTLYNWARGRCEIDMRCFADLTKKILTDCSLDYILINAEHITDPDGFDSELYNLAEKFKNELHCLANLTGDRKKSVSFILDQLMELEHFKYVESKNNSTQ